MIVLGIDTSGYINAVGISDGVNVLADASFPARTDSLEQIVDNIDSVLKKANLALKDVAGIGVGLGPGSWTGIKVGVTVGKMLAFSANKPVAGIPTLDALAYGVRDKSPLVCAVIGAGIRDTIYAAFYRFANDLPVKEGDYFTGDAKDIAPLVKEPVTLVGSDANHYYELLTNEDKSLNTKIKALEATPSGAAVACLAAMRLKQGKADDTLSLMPLYLKESTAKVFVNKYSAKA